MEEGKGSQHVTSFVCSPTLFSLLYADKKKKAKVRFLGPENYLHVSGVIGQSLMPERAMLCQGYIQVYQLP